MKTNGGIYGAIERFNKENPNGEVPKNTTFDSDKLNKWLDSLFEFEKTKHRYMVTTAENKAKLVNNGADPTYIITLDELENNERTTNNY